ncbi:MAG: nitronate monooxygenase [Candidatus Sericytochromatia bacterium]|nr:nitronate monooxygenase [Candidatus Sericytochromatia bacterium]
MGQTTITQLLGIRYPIIAAPMFLVSNVEMVVAVSEAGGLGTFPALNARNSDMFREMVRAIKQRTNAPFGVNLILLNNPRLEDDMRICLEEKVPVLITSLGDPSRLIQEAHRHGIHVFCDVVNVRHAQKAKAAGADALVAVSAGAGGHAGVITPFVLIPWLKRETQLPVIAAGGLADGVSLAGALALGADAGYFGTRFIASEEAPVEAAFKQAICAASPEDIEYTPEVTGHPANFLRDSLLQWRESQAAGESDLKRWRDVWSAGQTVGLIEAVKPCATIVQEIVREYEEARSGMVAIPLAASSGGAR